MHSSTSSSTQREGKLTGSSLIVALVSLLSFLEAKKCIPFHFNYLDICTVSILCQLLYESSRLRSARIQFRDRSVSRNHFARPQIIKSKVNPRYSKHRVLRCFGTYIVFVCLKRFFPGVFLFVYIIYMNESKLLNAVF